MPAAPPGQRVADLFASYRRLPVGSGARRAMASRLIVANEALVQATVDCLCGRKPLVGLRRPFGGCDGFDHIDHDDAMQAGRIAFAKALDQFDPEKAPSGMKNFSYYLLQKTRYELHKIECYGGVHVMHVPEKHAATHRKHVTFFGSPKDLDNAADRAELHGPDYGDLAEVDPLIAERIEEWQETGEWPSSLAQLEAERARGELEAKRKAEENLTGWERFVRRCRFAHAARVPTFDAHNQYRLDCREAGDDEMSRPEFVDELGEKFKVEEVWVRIPPRSSVRALAGVALCAA